MSKNNELEKQLDNLWKDKGAVLTLNTKNQKYAIISDMHMGDGGKSDDFRINEQATNRALTYYLKNNYNLILLGDVEELWQFSIDDIIKRYDNKIYKIIRKFGRKRVIRVFGNHDLEWKMQDPIIEISCNILTAYEAIKLKDTNGALKLLLVHGHQGTIESDKFSRLSKPIVRFYGNKIEPIYKIDKHSSAPRSPIVKGYEKERYEWAKKRKVMLICGHSHRAFFASKSKLEKLRKEMKEIRKKLRHETSIINREKLSGELIGKTQQIIDEKMLRGEYKTMGRNPAPHYFNTGCALYSDGLTMIEIENGTIKLVKWHRTLKNKKPFDIYEQASLSDCIKNL